MVHQGYLEPHSGHGGVVEPGRQPVWTSSAGRVRPVRSTWRRCEAPDPDGASRIVPMEIGGGFGGKLVWS